MLKGISFNWNSKRLIAGFIFGAINLLLIMVWQFLVVLGFMTPAIMLFPVLIEHVSELMLSQTITSSSFIGFIPMAVFLLVMLVTLLAAYFGILKINAFVDKYWNKIPNKIKGEPIIIRNKDTARQAI